MNKFVVYHVVTERPMSLNQIIEFNGENHSGVYGRVMGKKEIVDDIYLNPDKYDINSMDHHTKVALRELALEEVRKNKYPEYPSRLSSLYVSSNLEDAYNWAKYFIELGRPVFQIVKLEVEGNSFTGDAHNCFDGTLSRTANLKLAEEYWNNIKNKKGENPIYETIVDGKIMVVEIIKDFTRDDKKII